MPVGKHRGQHGDDCFGCRIKYVNIDPSATPSRRNTVAPTGTRYNRWEAGIVRDERGMPLLDKNLEPVGTKEYAEKYRRQYEENKKKVVQSDP